MALTPRPMYWRDLDEALIRQGGSEFEEAFLAVQLELDPILQADRKNPFAKSTYASLALLLATVKPVMNKHGLSLRQFAGAFRAHGTDTRRWHTLPICTLITHVATGQYEMAVVPLPIDTKDGVTSWSMGSAITFGRRYGLQSYLGMATIDNDGAAQIQMRLDSKQNADALEAIMAALEKTADANELTQWVEQHQDAIHLLGEEAITKARIAYDARKKSLHATAESKKVKKEKS